MQSILSLFLPFKTPGEALGPLIVSSYDPALVLLSYLVAAFASLTALGMSRPIIASAGIFSRLAWVGAGAIAMGGGVWAMHFIGMLAFEIPVAVGYDAEVTLYSIVPAVFAAAVALMIVSRPNRHGIEVFLVGGVLMGAGIGLMHFTGMAAMRMENAVMRYDPVLFAGSILTAIVLAFIALVVYDRALRVEGPKRQWVRLAAALIMGAAVSGMHYTAMAGFTLHAVEKAAPFSPMTDSEFLALAAALVTAAVMVLAIVATGVEHAIRTIRVGRDRLETLVSLSPDLICTIEEGVITFINPAGNKMLGVPLHLSLVGERLADFIHADYAPIIGAGRDALNELAQMGEPLPIKMLSMKGKQVDAEMAVRRIGGDEAPSFFIEIHDMTAKKQTAMEILRREQHITAIMDNAADGIVTMDEEGNIETFNAAASHLFQRSASEITGTHFCDLMDESCKEILLGQHEVRALRGDGLAFYADLSVSDVALGDKKRFIAIVRDITNRKQAQEQMHHLANHDLVTNLPNRLSVQSYLNKALEKAGDGSVLFLGIRQHQRVNDTLGHDLGEKLLRMIGARLEEIIGQAGMVGLWSPGEYVITLPGVSDHKNIERLSALLMDGVVTSHDLNGHEININADIGVSLFPADGDTPYRLVKAAGMAMFACRNEGSWPCHYFTRDIETRVEDRHYMESKLRHAIERNQLQAFYQPKIDLKTGKVKGMEALLRWVHPTLGMVSPVDFIPIAEETGLIVPIGEWILQTACRDTKAWHDAGFKGLSVAVNLSGRQFEASNLLDFIKNTLSETGLAPEHLELEVTESALMGDVEEGLIILTQLREMGIRIAIDDFGTGYSSLSYLKNLPIDTLKIDQSFVRNVTEDSDDAAIASTIVGMARNLSLGVVAEGIETEEHEGFLKSLNCDIGQGYLYAKPMTDYDFSAFLKGRSASPARKRA